MFLVGVQDVDRKSPGTAERAVALRLVVDADQDQRRVEGDRRERAGRQADRTLIGVERGDHGDACSEMAENLSKFVGRDHRSYVAGDAPECNHRAPGGMGECYSARKSW